MPRIKREKLVRKVMFFPPVQMDYLRQVEQEEGRTVDEQIRELVAREMRTRKLEGT